MTNNVLYYPYINVPENAWFLRVLLYWDKVGSIVPLDYLYNPHELEHYMQSLVSEGLVKQIVPLEHIDKIPNFSEVFIDLAIKYKHEMVENRNALEDLPTSRIHIEKLGSIGDELCRIKLAKPDSFPWYFVESNLANMFMAYLARSLSCLPEIDSRPITDTMEQLNVDDPLRTDRNIILKDLLPSPQKKLTAFEIARFKFKNQKYLEKFRYKIESFTIEATGIPNEEMRRERTERFILDTKDDIDNIVDAMKTQGWKSIAFVSLLSCGVAAPTYLNALHSGTLWDCVAAAFGGGVASSAIIQEISNSQSLKKSYFTYAAIARKTLN